MCLSPIVRPNVNFGSARKGVNYLKDCHSTNLSIPCGHCAECIAVKQMSLIERVQMQALVSYTYMVTLTYNPESLRSVVASDGFEFSFADIVDMQNMIRRIKEYNLIDRPWSHFYVSEKGGLHQRPHFHLLVFLEKRDTDSWLTPLQYEPYLYQLFLDQWKRNYGSKKKPDYKPCLTLKFSYKNGKRRSNYDCHFVQPSLTDSGVSDVAWYCLKYMLKPDDREVKRQQALKLNLPEDEYSYIWNLIRSRWDSSPSFGLGCYNRAWNLKIWNYLRDGVEKSASCGSEFPFYFNPDDGTSWPLMRYYFNKVVNINDAHRFFYNQKSNKIDSNRSYREKSASDILKSLSDYRKHLNQVFVSDSDKSDFDIM